MYTCLFCRSEGPFSTVEHIVPESLGNDNLLLREHICDVCQAYFGKEIEQYVLSKTPLGFWRTILGIKTKQGRSPSVDFSQPKRQKGAFPIVHPLQDNIGFTYHEDGSTSVEINNPDIVKEIVQEGKNQFNFVFTPKVIHMVGRFLCKISVELICLSDPEQARSETLLPARRYARFGDFDGLWPIFHFTKGSLQDFKRVREDNGELVEDIDCYSYSLFEVDDKYLLFHFCIGTDNWVISLNDPYPQPIIRNAFPDSELNLIWYDKSEWKAAG